MNRHKAILLAFATLAAGTLGTQPVSAQTFKNYRCVDGTQFIVGFYDLDKRAFLQIDGEPHTLAKAGGRLRAHAIRGKGITLRIDKSGATTVKHLKRPVTACTVI